MASVTKDQIRAFEARLDAAFARRAIHGFDANETLSLASALADAAALRQPIGGMAAALNDGIITFASHLVSGRAGEEPDIEVVAEDLMFGSHYHMVRDLLYYAYNAPGSLDWSIEERRVEIRFADRTIPRQFFTAWNEYVLNSMNHFAGRDGTVREIIALLKGQDEWTVGPALEAVGPLVAAEADHKLAAYFSILDRGADIDLGGYTYAQAHSIYRAMMIKALYHRYQSEVNEAFGSVFMDAAGLEDALAEETGVARDAVGKILSDIVFDAKAVRGRLDASYFSLFREGAAPHHIIMRPWHFSTAEGLVQLLRVVAQRRPKTFLANVSNILGAQFTRRLATAFEGQGFIAHSDVSLRELDHTLPDIDLLIISEEPTLGFVLLVCEVKSPLPPLWGKDQLRVLAPDSVSKAFRQVEAINAFLKTSKGISFIRSLLPPGGLEHFADMVVLVNQLIITSDNSGMFFGNEETPIMNFRTVERMLRRSDGDVAHILSCIRTYNEGVDRYLATSMQTFDMDGVEVSFEVCTGAKLLEFPKGDWRSSGVREQVIADFIAGGHQPFDALEGVQVT